MAKRGRRIPALESRPRLPEFARKVLRVWNTARLCRRGGFSGAEVLDPTSILACVDASGLVGPDCRGAVLRLILEHDARWLRMQRDRKRDPNG